ncbi:ComC/BlpC family peptide pheromone/bacteriocin [Streptococcus porcinus]|uniref:ComC/BlpC family peptide pheromone/bacteriocin n=1 Tax=Streptococcus porcinus TaxID=1340 RepID=A0A7V9WR18_STRPO|nr:ComC/BlpC family peptide pheromone/bacteriocin [Streptococcus porcinus]MBA2795505.1 ComC/BlpC family peptide pheromone/bacteriocin [Streptococcus porcinus]
MNKKAIEHFDVIDDRTLENVLGGGFGWGAALAGLFGGLAASPTLEDLNGKKLPKPSSCSLYGIGGTPNTCNF